MSLRTTFLAAAVVAATASLIHSHWKGSSTQEALAQVAQPASPGPQPQPTAPRPPMTAPGSPPTVPTGDVKVDESALRYFAAQGDTRRLEAELARLKALYPEWTPPADLRGAAPVATTDPELERLWTLFGEGNLSEVRSAIAARTAADGKWQPPQDLLDKLGAAESARRLVNASNAGQWTTVLDVATQAPGLLTCENADALWRVAEAFAKTAKADRARDAYRYILVNCQNPGERLATLQKASTLLPDAEVRDLLRLERAGPDGKGEFGSIRIDLARNRVGKAAQDPTIAVEPDELAAVERAAQDGSSPDDPLLVGYYHYSHGDAARSLDWFKKAVDRKGEARAAEGYALALLELKRFAEAEAVAEPWRTATPANTKAYLTTITTLFAQTPPPRVEAAVLARGSRAVADARDAAGAQALGWYAYNIGQIRTASDWFTTALKWRADSEPAAFGLALSRQRLKDRSGVEAIVAQWRGRSERIADLMDPRRRPAAGAGLSGRWPSPILPAPDIAPATTMSLQGRRPPTFASGSVSVARSGSGRCRTAGSPAVLRSLSPSAALVQGWCLLDLKRPREAAAAFEIAQQRGRGQVASDATYGLTLAYIAADLTAEAATAATQGALSASRRTELAATIATQRALAAYRNGEYKATLINLDERARVLPEQNDLLMLRGWSYFNLGRYSDAEKVFTAVSKTGTAESEQAFRGLNAIGQKLGRIRE